jgi:CheY-like chemotaxis protein
VVLCDIGLPGMDGYAVARALRGDPATASLYLIAVSGYASPEDQQRSLAAGFDLHLNKPQGFSGLSERLQSLPISRR